MVISKVEPLQEATTKREEQAILNAPASEKPALVNDWLNKKENFGGKLFKRDQNGNIDDDALMIIMNWIQATNSLSPSYNPMIQLLFRLKGYINGLTGNDLISINNAYADRILDNTSIWKSELFDIKDFFNKSGEDQEYWIDIWEQLSNFDYVKEVFKGNDPNDSFMINDKYYTVGDLTNPSNKTAFRDALFLKNPANRMASKLYNKKEMENSLKIMTDALRASPNNKKRNYNTDRETQELFNKIFGNKEIPADKLRDLADYIVKQFGSGNR